MTLVRCNQAHMCGGKGLCIHSTAHEPKSYCLMVCGQPSKGKCCPVSQPQTTAHEVLTELIEKELRVAIVAALNQFWPTDQVGTWKKFVSAGDIDNVIAELHLENAVETAYKTVRQEVEFEELPEILRALRKVQEIASQAAKKYEHDQEIVYRTQHIGGWGNVTTLLYNGDEEETGDALDLDAERTYQRSDGGILATVDVTRLNEKQDAKIARLKDEEWAVKFDEARKQILREVGEWLEKDDNYLIVSKYEIDLLKRGELPQ